MVEDQWWIAHGKNVRGPFPTALLRRFIRSGNATEGMRYSRDGATWTVGRELPELFAPPPAGGASAGPPRTRVEAYGRVFDDATDEGGRTVEADTSSPPLSIKIVSWIVYLTATLLLFSLFVQIARIPGGPDARDLLPGLFVLLLAFFYAVLGYLLVKGHHYARITLVVVNVIWAISCLRHFDGGGVWVGLSTMAFPLMVAGTLLSDSAVRHCLRGD